MSSPVLHPPRTRRGAALAATLLVGAGAGAGLALGLENHSTPAVTAPQSAAATASPQPAASQNSQLTVGQIYNAAKQGVVDITISSQQQGPFGQAGAQQAEGSGFVIDKQGDIVTNDHVVSGASAITVKFSDGRRVGARVIGEDPTSDLAVIRVSVPGSDLQPLTLGDSSKVQVGDSVVAIGSPYGLSGSVTSGIVSALGRDITAPNNYTISGAIQTDAPINHGNSGGPLIDARGRVIGVNSQIDSSSGDSSGVGFAIPSSTVQRITQGLVSGQKVAHPYLGVSLADRSGGATIASVTSGSPAQRAGLAAGDVITAVDGKSVSSSSDLTSAVAASSPGEKIVLTINRGGATKQLTVTVGSHS